MAMFASFLRPVFPASHVQHISGLQSKFALRPHHCKSMVDIQSATAEIRRGKNKKKERIRDQPQEQKHNVRICYTQGGHNNNDNAGYMFKR